MKMTRQEPCARQSQLLALHCYTKYGHVLPVTTGYPALGRIPDLAG